MKWTQILLTCCMVICSLNATSCWSKQQSSSPNIVFIVADYMGYADTEPFGGTDIKTPALSALAQQGIKFTHHYSSAPSCIPARASLFSGQYPHRVLSRFDESRGVGLHRDDNKLLTGLKSSGYRTALLGKWHLGSESGFSPNDHGFDHFFGYDSWVLNQHTHLTSRGQQGLLLNDSLTHRDGYLADLVTAEAIQFIEEKSANPFFVMLSYNGGLPPYQHPDLAKEQWREDWSAEGAKRADYIAMIERMDSGIEKILNTLDKESITDNTLVIFTYDHGGRNLVNSGNLFHGFGTLWEGGIRVPLIIRWPKEIKQGVVVTQNTIAMDVTATMLDAANVQLKIGELDGRSLLPSTTKSKSSHDRALYWRARGMEAVIQGDWKYLVDNHSQFLFNLKKDEGERKNLIYTYPDKTETLRKKLSSWE
ncbi:sulfatase-like hydrolase/transferase [Pseudoalteromonas sp. GB56]